MADAREKFIFRFVGTFYFLNPLSVGDVLDGALITEKSSVLIADGAGVFTKPDLGAISPVNFVFEQLNEPMRFNRALKFIPLFGVDVYGLADVAHTINKVFWGIVSMDARQGRVRAEKPAIGSRLENALDRIFEHNSVFLFRFRSSFLGLFPFRDILRCSEHVD